uniref:Uncharacterized protein n=1 Tax=Juglanconis sp. TaxID=2041886 RepID=A0A291LID5_9PEZI|nr:hypothetical protein [Juglanconis sp.]
MRGCLSAPRKILLIPPISPLRGGDEGGWEVESISPDPPDPPPGDEGDEGMRCKLNKMYFPENKIIFIERDNAKEKKIKLLFTMKPWFIGQAFIKNSFLNFFRI